MESNEGGQPPPPSYEAAVGESTRYDRAVVYGGIPAGKGRGDQAPRQTISDSPHESDDEETILLKAELRRLRQEKLEQKKRLLLNEIGRERTYSGTVCRNVTQGSSGAGPYQPSMHSSTPQITSANVTTPGGITVHPTTVYNPAVPAAASSPGEESDGSETGGKGKGSPVMFVLVSVILVVTFLIILASFL